MQVTPRDFVWNQSWPKRNLGAARASLPPGTQLFAIVSSRYYYRFFRAIVKGDRIILFTASYALASVTGRIYDEDQDGIWHGYGSPEQIVEDAGKVLWPRVENPFTLTVL